MSEVGQRERKPIPNGNDIRKLLKTGHVGANESPKQTICRKMATKGLVW